MLIIGASSIALASEDPIDEDAPINLLLEKLDYGFTAVFTFEMIVKVRRKKMLKNLFILSTSFLN